jgi:hypothetical protein
MRGEIGRYIKWSGLLFWFVLSICTSVFAQGVSNPASRILLWDKVSRGDSPENVLANYPDMKRAENNERLLVGGAFRLDGISGVSFFPIIVLSDTTAGGVRFGRYYVRQVRLRSFYEATQKEEISRRVVNDMP